MESSSKLITGIIGAIVVTVTSVIETGTITGKDILTTGKTIYPN